MKKLSAFTALICVTASLHAQLQYDWHHSNLDTASSWIQWIDYGDQDEIYTVCSASVPTDMDYSLATVINPGPNYVAVYSHTGIYLRSWSINTWIRGGCIADNGDVILYGWFSGSVDFDPSVGTYMVNGAASDTYVARYTKLGQLLWVRSFGPPVGCYPDIMSVDEAGNMITLGLSISGVTMDLDPGAGTDNCSFAQGMGSAVVRLDQGGNYQWSVAIANVLLRDASANTAGEIILTGIAADTVDFDPGPATAQYIAAYPNFWYGDFFVARYANWGAYLWHCGAGTAADAGIGYQCHLNDGGEIFVSGYFPLGTDVDPGSGVSAVTSSNQYGVARYNANGSFAWLTDDGGGFTHDNATGNTYMFTQNGLDCISPAGTSMWSVPLTFTGFIALSQNDKLCIAGQLFGSHDFDPSAGTMMVSGNGNQFKVSFDYLLASVEDPAEPLVSVYPNPASEYLILTGAATDRATKCVIVNSIGQEVLVAEINPGENRVDISSLPAGVYHLLRMSDSGTASFVVQRE